MDASYRRDGPGKSPMGMDLVPVYADDQTDRDQRGDEQLRPGDFLVAHEQAAEPTTDDKDSSLDLEDDAGHLLFIRLDRASGRILIARRRCVGD